jgi:predicted NAD/FAD-dependent oxidoreductase
VAGPNDNPEVVQVGRVLIVGAGVAGLLAAHELRANGHDVLLVDKGHQPGGRLATRRVGDATFDTGAQFLTVRDPRVAVHLAAWLDAGVAREWFRGSPDDPPGGPGTRRTAAATVTPATAAPRRCARSRSTSPPRSPSTSDPG